MLPLLLAAGCAGDAGEPAEIPSDYAEIISAALWADDMTVSLSDDDMLTVGDDGVPDHDVLEAYALMDGTTTPVVTSTYTMTFPMAPVVATETTDTSGGAIGVAISGGRYFNPYEGDGTTVALDSNFEVDGVPFVDSCNAHPLPDGGDYHYHGVPYCITDVIDTDGAHSRLIGVLLDGFTVYGPWGDGGSPPTDLDACSGHTGVTPEFADAVYHYHLTETAPYSIPCYRGEVESTGMGPPA
ncbi:MAG: YHYH protein [Pseudomonadota bacterium]|nr:YHYH protein [Pseudomonadota bacterium]